MLDELNVRELKFGEVESILQYDLKPNLSIVGPKYGRLAPMLRQEVVLGPEELLVEPRERAGFALAREGDLAVALRTELDPELVDEGLVRELVHKVQNLRREEGFDIEETISVKLRGSPHIVSLLRGPWGEYFKAEVLARELRLDDDASGAAELSSLRLEGEELWVGMERLGRVGSG